MGVQADAETEGGRQVQVHTRCEYLTSTALQVKCNPRRGCPCRSTVMGGLGGFNVSLLVMLSFSKPQSTLNGMSFLVRPWRLSTWYPRSCRYSSRIAPWVHYVPIQISYADLYDALAFFRTHDDLAESIATQGKEWSQNFWRKEDMAAYLYR